MDLHATQTAEFDSFDLLLDVLEEEQEQLRLDDEYLNDERYTSP